MKLKFFAFSLFIAVAAISANSIDSKPATQTKIDPTQMMAWLVAGIPSYRIAQLVEQHGLAGALTQQQLQQLESAGATENLTRTLSAIKAPKPATPIPAALLKAAAENRLQHYHEAELQLRQVLQADPQNAALHFALGAMLRQQSEWDDAFDEVTQATRRMPELPENHSAFAYIFYRLDDGPNSIAEARTALSMDPQNAEAYQYLGLGLYSNGQYRAAVHAFIESLAREGDNPDTYYDMGIALHADGNLPASVMAYSKAIHLRPEFWEAHSNLALVFHEQGKLAEAVAEYREAKRIAPDEASVRNNLGNTYCDLGEYDAAITELRELYREHPEWQQGHGCLASAYMAKKNYDDAIAELQIALRQNPTGSTEHRVLGQAFLLDHRPEEALREFRLAVSLNPDSDLAHHFLGTALFEQQQLQAAEKEFREALRLKPSADNHYSLAACLMSMDRYEEALSELELATRLDPDRQLYRVRRDELLQLMKNSIPR